MAKTANDFEEPEQNLADDAMAFKFPMWLRRAAVVVLTAILVGSLAAFWNFVLNPDTSVTPNKLGLGPLLIFSIFGLVAVLIPWEDYGLRIKKFGPFEFEQILATQATEHVQEIEELRTRIESLESDLVGREDTSDSNLVEERRTKVLESKRRQETLEERLLAFLKNWRRYGFSPLRIEKWGAKQPTFTDLGNYSGAEIRQALRALVTKGNLETAISRKGNTLYRIPR